MIKGRQVPFYGYVTTDVRGERAAFILSAAQEVLNKALLLHEQVPYSKILYADKHAFHTEVALLGSRAVGVQRCCPMV